MKFLKKNWISVVLIIVAAVFVCGLFTRLTDGFTDWSFQPDLNEENLFFEQIEDGAYYDNPQIDAIAENGLITLNGSVVSNNPGTVTLSTPIQITTLTLPKGTYTFSCFESPSYRTHYAVGLYNGNTWYADFETAPNNATADPTYLGRTVTLTEETVVTFYIYVCEGAEFENVEARPVLVTGDEVGSYSKGLFD